MIAIRTNKVAIGISIILPFTLQAVLLSLGKAYARAPWNDNTASLWINCGIGALCFAWTLRTHRVLGVMVYVPIVWILLFWFSLAFVGVIWGDWL
jgi:hypothetical protein